MSWSSDDIDVLIDMLDDSERAWYAAKALEEVLSGTKGVRLTQLERMEEMLGLPTVGSKERRTFSASSALMRRVTDQWKRERLPRTEEVTAVWVVHGEAFKTRSAAEAYADFVRWRGSK